MHRILPFYFDTHTIVGYYLYEILRFYKEIYMRLRNIPGAGEVIDNSPYCIKEPVELKGKWHDFLGNNNPIHIEVGMGKGRFLMDLARLHPEINYIGIERYTSVLLRAVQKMQEDELPNVHFLCIDAATLPDIFDRNEVDRIYLNFSDPWPKDRHARRRLTSSEFLARYDLFSHLTDA